MAEQREVGVSTWGGPRPLGEARRRGVAAAPAEPKARTIDVRDAVALVLLLFGAALVIGVVAHFGGWWAVLGLLGVGLIAAGAVLAYRPGGDG